MKIHKYCKLFPEIQQPEFGALVADIKDNGLRQPIITFKGQILDGQNRFNACKCAKIKPVFEEFTGTDPLGFVISANMNRRHLTDDQRAAIAAEIATHKRGNSAESAHLKNEEAAVFLKVTKRQVQMAKQVKKESPKAFKKVKEGKKTLNQAHEEKHPRKPKSTPIPNPVLPAAAEPTGEHPSQKDIPDDIGKEKPAESVPVVLPEVAPAAELTPVQEPSSKPKSLLMTPARFKIELEILEARVNEICDGNQKEREKYGIIANAFTSRLMNSEVKKPFNPYGA